MSNQQREDLAQAINTMQRAMNGPAAAYRQYLHQLIEAAKRDLQAGPAPLSLLGSGDAAAEMRGLVDAFKQHYRLPLQVLPSLTKELEICDAQGYGLCYFSGMESDKAVANFIVAASNAAALLAAASTGGGAVPDELLSAYCDLAASHDDALPITASTDGEGLVMLYHNDGTSIEADQRLADFVAAACNAAGAGFQKDLAAFGREDAAPQHIVVGEATRPSEH